MPFVNTTLQAGPYTPNGLTTNFPFFFEALSADEVQVVLVDNLGVETILPANSYDLHDIGNPNGGLIVFPLAPDYAGQTLYIRAIPSFTQEFDFENQGAYNPSDINRAFDRDAQRALYLRDQIANGVVTPGGGPSGPVDWSAIQNVPDFFTPAPHTHNASDITSGILDVTRLPNLDTAKIISGVFDSARIPSLDASKVTSGVFDAARIPPQSTGVVAPTNIASLTSPQQAIIVEGTLVTTSDGQRWVYKGTGSKVLEASYVNIGSSAPDWSVIASKPANVVAFAALTGAADKLAYFTGAGALALTNLTATGRTITALTSTPSLQALASPLTTKGDLATYAAAPARLPVGTDGQFLIADSTQSTGLRWMSQSSSAGVQNMPNFTTVFSGNGDGVTNNDAAFTAAEGQSTYQRIWLPEGRYLTNRLNSQFAKRYVGPGIIVRPSGGGLNNFSRYNDVAWTHIGSEYGEGEDVQFADVEYKIISTGARHEFVKSSTGFYPYFYAPATPHFFNFINNGGGSGFSGHTSSAITAGSTTTVGIVGGTSGWVAGDKIGLTQTTTLDGTILETAFIQSVNVGAGTITLTGVTANSYATGSVISHGARTMNTAYLGILNHNGNGDAYLWTGRVIVNRPALPSQTSFEQIATGGIIGGDMVATADGNYLTGWECQYSDNGADIAVGGSVNSYIRTNNTRNRNVFWIHDLVKMDPPTVGNNLKPIDVVYWCAMYAEAGLDMSRSVFGNQRAITLARGHRLYLDAVGGPGDNAHAGGYIPDGGSSFICVNSSGQLELQNGATSLTFLPGTGIQGIGALVMTGSIQGSTLVSTNGLTVSSGTATVGGHVNIGGLYKIGNVPVVVSRRGSIPDTTLDLSTACATINAILSGLRQHGLITGAGNPT